MGNFNEAWNIVKQNEGGYNPGIGTKETYMGIDRGANPSWSGWKIIDSLKPITTAAMNIKLSQNKEIQANIIKFYVDNYFNPLKLAQIIDQNVVNNLTDCSINQGTGIAAKFLQMACNASLIEVGDKSLPLVIDGAIGLKTITLANALPGESIYNHINLLRESRYRDTVVKNPSLKQWLPVWLKRLTPYNHNLINH